MVRAVSHWQSGWLPAPAPDSHLRSEPRGTTPRRTPTEQGLGLTPLRAGDESRTRRIGRDAQAPGDVAVSGKFMRRRRAWKRGSARRGSNPRRAPPRWPAPLSAIPALLQPTCATPAEFITVVVARQSLPAGARYRLTRDGPNESHVSVLGTWPTPGFDQSQTPSSKIRCSCVHSSPLNSTV